MEIEYENFRNWELEKKGRIKKTETIPRSCIAFNVRLDYRHHVSRLKDRRFKSELYGRFCKLNRMLRNFGLETIERKKQKVGKICSKSLREEGE